LNAMENVAFDFQAHISGIAKTPRASLCTN
jgi:hypothetical protein